MLFVSCFVTSSALKSNQFRKHMVIFFRNNFCHRLHRILCLILIVNIQTLFLGNNLCGQFHYIRPKGFKFFLYVEKVTTMYISFQICTLIRLEGHGRKQASQSCTLVGSVRAPSYDVIV